MTGRKNATSSVRGSAVLLLLTLGLGCRGGHAEEALLPAETFTWVRQPISFAPPPARWERQGTLDGGLTGVRFILRGGQGQCIAIAAHRKLAERDRRETLARLVAEHESMSRRDFLHELSLARPITQDPISDREAEVARAINREIDRASTDYLGQHSSSVGSDLRSALAAAESYEPTLDELLPHILLQPGAMNEPDRWRIGYERDTTIAGWPAYACDDTLIAPENTLLYHEVFWVVSGCAFRATFQGFAENLGTFHRVLDTVDFPGPDDAATP